MVYNEMKFRTTPSYYSRADVERTMGGAHLLDRFKATMGFAIERYNRAHEPIMMEVDTIDPARMKHQVVFYLHGKREYAEVGHLNGDLLTIESLCCYDAGTRQDFLQILPRLSRILIEKEYLPAMRR